ncbi:MAG: hypothetical protein NC324_02960 [Bacteroides sp.]|nr:hypothetical protein [Bacteroides sp.]
MVEWMGVAAATMVCAVLFQHMGLTVEMARVAGKIAACYKCCTFWGCLLALLISGADVLTAACLSIFMSYLSHYFALALMGLQKLYDLIWQRINRE